MKTARNNYLKKCLETSEQINFVFTLFYFFVPDS